MRAGTSQRPVAPRRPVPAMRSVLVGLGAVVALGGLGACDLAPPDQDPEQNPSSGQSSDRSPDEGRSPGSTDAATGDGRTLSGPVDLADPIEFALVTETSPAPCTGDALPSPQQEACLHLGESMEIAELDDLSMGPLISPTGEETDEQVLNMSFTAADGEAFYDLTSHAVQQADPQIAMLVEGEVITAPAVNQPIAAGEVQISGWDEAEEFVAQAHAG